MLIYLINCRISPRNQDKVGNFDIRTTLKIILSVGGRVIHRESSSSPVVLNWLPILFGTEALHETVFMIHATNLIKLG